MMPAMPLPALLRGRRVVLRPFVASDITDAYIGWLNDAEVVRYSNQRFVRHTRESCERYYAGFAGSPHLFVSLRLAAGAGGAQDVPGTPGASGMSGAAGEQAVGTLTAYRSLPHGTADIGILLGERAAWGQGIGLEAWQLLSDWLLTTPGLRKLTAGTLASNRAMLAVAERSGMQREGVRHAQELVDGVPIDIVQFARFAEVAHVAHGARGAHAAPRGEAAHVA